MNQKFSWPAFSGAQAFAYFYIGFAPAVGEPPEKVKARPLDSPNPFQTQTCIKTANMGQIPFPARTLRRLLRGFFRRIDPDRFHRSQKYAEKLIGVNRFADMVPHSRFQTLLDIGRLLIRFVVFNKDNGRAPGPGGLHGNQARNVLQDLFQFEFRLFHSIPKKWRTSFIIWRRYSPSFQKDIDKIV
jgi:hypothetical protein